MLILAVLSSLPLTGCHSPSRCPHVAQFRHNNDSRYWLHNMVVLHNYSHSEIAAATGLNTMCVDNELRHFKISRNDRLPRPENASILIAPYPGGRHPRIGFLDGAIDPQRGTKVSIFLPWDQDSYVVYDVPEAIWSNLGLTFLAHKHIATIWDDQGIRINVRDWKRTPDGGLEMRQDLPNQIHFGTNVASDQRMVTIDFWIENNTGKILTDLRTQMCLMLSRAKGFNQLSNDNKIITDPYVACRNEEGNRWIITAFTHCNRPWANDIVPCMHSDPKLPDCPNHKTVRARGIVAFYEGTDIEAEFLRLENSGWREIDQ
jgi:hypothetical protein